MGSDDLPPLDNPPLYRAAGDYLVRSRGGEKYKYGPLIVEMLKESELSNRRNTAFAR